MAVVPISWDLALPTPAQRPKIINLTMVRFLYSCNGAGSSRACRGLNHLYN
jgi:hypothetical protein